MLLSMTVENQVMRLPRYARGLRMARLGMFLMLLHFVLNAYLVTLLIRSSVDADHLIAVMKFTLYANLGAVGLMLLGAVISIPDFLAAKMPLTRLVVSVIGFAISAAALAWITKIMFGHTAASDVRTMTILRDIGYAVGIVAMLRSIRQTAQANEHYALRDASDTVTNMTAGGAILDILYQLLFGGGGGALMTFYMIILGIVGGLALVLFWVYIHLRLAKFLKAAAILVYEPHNLPVARLVSKPEVASVEPVRPAPRPSGPVARPSAEDRASQPLLVVAAELRPAVVPRAETAPGAPTDEPKLLR